MTQDSRVARSHHTTTSLWTGRFHLSPFIGAADSPEVSANPLAILGLPWVGAVIRHLLDSPFIHWRGNDRETERERERVRAKKVHSPVSEINTSGGLSNNLVALIRPEFNILDAETHSRPAQIWGNRGISCYFATHLLRSIMSLEARI